MSFNVGPVLYGKNSFSIVLVTLGFGTSIKVGLIVSISYPFTYALPGDILQTDKSGPGIDPPAVNWPSSYKPWFPKLLFREFTIDTLNGFTI